MQTRQAIGLKYSFKDCLAALAFKVKGIGPIFIIIVSFGSNLMLSNNL